MNRARLIELSELLLGALSQAERGDPYQFVCRKEELARVMALLEEEEDCERIRKLMEEL